MTSESSNSRIIFINKLDDRSISRLKVVVLPHPKDASPIAYLFDSRDLYEFQSIQPRKYGSWFVNQRVLSQNGYFLGSKFNICYLCLPYLRKHGSRFSPIDQILAPLHAYDRLELNQKHYLLLHEVCDVNDELGEDMILYRYNEGKTLDWLKRRVEATAKTIAQKRIQRAAAQSSSKNFNLSLQSSSVSADISSKSEVGDEDRILAIQIIADYLEDDLIDKLLGNYKYEKSLLQSKVSTTKRKADWELEMEVTNNYQLQLCTPQLTVCTIVYF